MKTKESIIKIIVVTGFIALIVISVAILIVGWLGGHFDSIDSLRAYIESFGIWAPLVLTLIQALQVILPVIPGFMGCIVGGAIFGAAGGFWINYIGISAGSIAAFWLARCFGVRLVNKMISLNKYESYLKRLNWSKGYTTILFFSILLPLAPDDFFCYLSGLIDMSPRKFTAIILIAKPWCILFYSIFFAYFI